VIIASYYFFDEPMTSVKIIGSLLIILGVYLIVR